MKKMSVVTLMIAFLLIIFYSSADASAVIKVIVKVRGKEMKYAKPRGNDWPKVELWDSAGEHLTQRGVFTTRFYVGPAPFISNKIKVSLSEHESITHGDLSVYDPDTIQKTFNFEKADINHNHLTVNNYAGKTGTKIPAVVKLIRIDKTTLQETVQKVSKADESILFNDLWAGYGYRVEGNAGEDRINPKPVITNFTSVPETIDYAEETINLYYDKKSVPPVEGNQLIKAPTKTTSPADVKQKQPQVPKFPISR